MSVWDLEFLYWTNLDLSYTRIEKWREATLLPNIGDLLINRTSAGHTSWPLHILHSSSRTLMVMFKVPNKPLLGSPLYYISWEEQLSYEWQISKTSQKVNYTAFLSKVKNHPRFLLLESQIFSSTGWTEGEGHCRTKRFALVKIYHNLINWKDATLYYFDSNSLSKLPCKG